MKSPNDVFDYLERPESVRITDERNCWAISHGNLAVQGDNRAFAEFSPFAEIAAIRSDNAIIATARYGRSKRISQISATAGPSERVADSGMFIDGRFSRILQSPTFAWRKTAMPSCPSICFPGKKLTQFGLIFCATLAWSSPANCEEAATPKKSNNVLDSIPLKIAKEPKYASIPRYALLVLGTQGESKVWMVEDGKRLYSTRTPMAI